MQCDTIHSITMQYNPISICFNAMRYDAMDKKIYDAMQFNI